MEEEGIGRDTTPTSTTQDLVFVTDYAKTSRAKCKEKKTCTNKEIGKGELRIGKQFPSFFFGDGDLMTEWYHPQCLFESFKRARKTTRKITDVSDIDGFGALKPQDQRYIRDLIEQCVPEYPENRTQGAKKKKGAQKKTKDAQKVTEESEMPPTKKAKVAGDVTITGVTLVSNEDGSSVAFKGVGTHSFGRGTKGCVVKDGKCSRRQVDVNIKGDCVTLTPRGANPCCLFRDNEPPIIMMYGTEYNVSSGDSFTLLANSFPYTIIFVTTKK